MCSSSTADYLVGVTIGEGSFGRVVHAKHKSTGQNVAIKVVEKVALKKQPGLMHAVWTEKTLLSQWDSEHVIPLYAAFHDEECVYLVMACSNGGDLSHAIQCGRQYKNIARWVSSIPHYGIQVISALEFIHSKKVLHADLKPDNILINESGRLQLADFGSAIALHDPKHREVWGTVDYSSPEVLKNSTNLTVGVDLWSLGCIIYAMFEGKSPFHSDSDALAIEKIMKFETLKLPISSTAKAKEGWNSLISGLMRPDPALRLGVSNYKDEGTVVYQLIRSSSVWDGTDMNSSSDAPFLAPKPVWWTESQKSTMKDGKVGWTAFLL